MKTNSWIGSIGLLLAIASCGQHQASNQTAPTTTVVVSPLAAPQAAQSPTGSVASPLGAVPPAPSVLPVPNLIPPTSATARVSQIDAGRSNPYANVTTTPRVTVSPAARPRSSTPTVAVQAAASVRSSPASLPARSNRPTTPNASTAARPSLQSNPSPVAPVAVRPAPSSPTPQATPIRPTAELARSIAVSGVVQTSGQTSAIVQSPQEGSRYVSVGDRLAGGRVLVKRIEVGTGEEAIVVFEQDGVEVSRSVGAGVQ
ncbi:hypothetical protein H6F67_20220 [Microcoleus sp. FACHB-1515]|uniref:hypothetical protein n=1 Tax=Cyanophyceae TaxID=3028117 RepID=UPI001687BBE4|nr:hypothetical protein [Microcoleus sp. FACHB-1515]MBD2092179.1 hypothetical protein [Microcoleus sp. FACHB-1515]